MVKCRTSGISVRKANHNSVPVAFLHSSWKYPVEPDISVFLKKPESVNP